MPEKRPGISAHLTVIYPVQIYYPAHLADHLPDRILVSHRAQAVKALPVAQG